MTMPSKFWRQNLDVYEISAILCFDEFLIYSDDCSAAISSNLLACQFLLQLLFWFNYSVNDLLPVPMYCTLYICNGNGDQILFQCRKLQWSCQWRCLMWALFSWGWGWQIEERPLDIGWTTHSIFKCIINETTGQWNIILHHAKYRNGF